MFDNIINVKIVDSDMMAMNSAEKEEVQFDKPFTLGTTKGIEIHLMSLQDQMVKTLKKLLTEGVKEIENMPRKDFVL